MKSFGHLTLSKGKQCVVGKEQSNPASRSKMFSMFYHRNFINNDGLKLKLENSYTWHVTLLSTHLAMAHNLTSPHNWTFLVVSFPEHSLSFSFSISPFCKISRLQRSLWSLPTRKILWFYDSLNPRAVVTLISGLSLILCFASQNRRIAYVAKGIPESSAPETRNRVKAGAANAEHSSPTSLGRRGELVCGL